MSFMSNKSILKEGVLDYIVKKFFLPKALEKDKEFIHKQNGPAPRVCSK